MGVGVNTVRKTVKRLCDLAGTECGNFKISLVVQHQLQG